MWISGIVIISMAAVHVSIFFVGFRGRGIKLFIYSNTCTLYLDSVSSKKYLLLHFNATKVRIKISVCCNII